MLGSTFAAATNIGIVTVGTAAITNASFTMSKLLAGTSLGGDGILSGAPDTFTRAGLIGGVTGSGAFATSTIAVGVNPVDGISGNGNDLAAAGTPTANAIGALVFGAASGTAATGPTMTHTYGIEAASIVSLKVGAGAVIKKFPAAQFIKAGGAEAASDVVVKIV